MQKLIYILFLITFIVSPLAAEIAGDFDNNEVIDTSDVVVLIAWIQETVFAGRVEGYTVTLDSVDERAEGILGATVSTYRLPDFGKDEFNDSPDMNLDSEDVAILIAYIMENIFASRNNTNFTLEDVEIRANNIWRLTGGVGKLPGTPIGTASFTTTITGITTDP